ncbi:MAG: ribonucleoside-diphosphate reductase subunit alpha [Chloracidobacterium sp.]|nr:ribonucleoside-diphosphate reductase subunit alpha [Chloracidobacterium sp.]MDW8216898.1 ribonucleoside-diphosphate reductase subunit alpha [Acidobacteriota bacterium]
MSDSAAARQADIAPSTMRVRKRNGTLEPVNLDKIVRAVGRCCTGLANVDAIRVATKTIGGLYDGATTAELDQLSINTAAALIVEEPEYARLAARLLATCIYKEVRNQNIHSFSQSIDAGHRLGLVADRLQTFVAEHQRKLNEVVADERDQEFEYFGLRTVYDRYLLRHPTARTVIETPQYFFLRVACALARTVAEAIELYRLLSSLEYMASTPTLFNAGTKHEQLSSCFLLDSPEDDLAAIYHKYTDVALLSKFSGGIGLAYHRVRAKGSLIRGTNGHSNGIVPWLKTLDSSVAAVNQCFAPETIVFTADGPKPIAKVSVGDLALGHSGRYRRVEQHMRYWQTDDMVELRVKHAVEPVRVTAGHPIFAIPGVPIGQSIKRTLAQLERGVRTPRWVAAGTLKPGDYVAQVIPTEIVPVAGLTDDDARMYGILLGDGHLARNGREWGVSGNPRSDAHLEFVREYLRARGIHFWEEGRGETYLQVRFAAGRGVVREATTGRIVGAGAPTLPFTYADLYDDNGDKRINRRFAHLPPSQTRALIRGLLETDGGVSRGAEIYFSSTSRPLVEGLRYQLLRLGIACVGQYRERDTTHTARRQDGSTSEFSGTTKCYDLRIPAVPEIAELVGCRPVTKRNWFVRDGYLWSRVRSVTPIAPTTVVHDLKVEDDETYMTSAALAHNGGKRKGACCVYLEPWHADIEDFLELRDNTGDEARRTHNLNLANWIPDLFMRRVEEDGLWSLFDPKVVPDFPDLYGEAFEKAYVAAEEARLYTRQVRARDLYHRMMRTLAQTGNGWMTFKDTSNRKCNQTARPGRVVHLSNLCTEIIEVTSPTETAVCNLGSLNLARHVTDGRFDFEKLARNVRTAVRQLDRVIDINFYPIPAAAESNRKWRPVGLGVMGLQDVFFQLRLPFDSPEALALSTRIQEEIYYHALTTSCDLAEELGPHPAFHETRAADGVLQFDLWGVTPPDVERWQALKQRIKAKGLRNSLLIAIAPTATIASICGCYEAIEPQVSNLFKRETLSGDFLQINRYLVADLKRLGLWNEDIRTKIKLADGSIQGIEEIPADVRRLYRTAWELPMRALIDMAAARGAYIDQSQSLNLFMEAPTIGKLSSMYMYAWKQGLKTTYYLRSRPATGIAKATVPVAAGASKKAAADAGALACALENPESCEACQ